MFPAFQNPVAMVHVDIYPDFPTYQLYAVLRGLLGGLPTIGSS